MMKKEFSTIILLIIFVGQMANATSPIQRSSPATVNNEGNFNMLADTDTLQYCQLSDLVARTLIENFIIPYLKKNKKDADQHLIKLTINRKGQQETNYNYRLISRFYYMRNPHFPADGYSLIDGYTIIITDQTGGCFTPLPDMPSLVLPICSIPPKDGAIEWDFRLPSRNSQEIILLNFKDRW